MPTKKKKKIDMIVLAGAGRSFLRKKLAFFTSKSISNNTLPSKHECYAEAGKKLETLYVYS